VKNCVIWKDNLMAFTADKFDFVSAFVSVTAAIMNSAIFWDATP
jgi:hypothetical protein